MKGGVVMTHALGCILFVGIMFVVVREIFLETLYWIKDLWYEDDEEAD